MDTLTGYGSSSDSEIEQQQTKTKNKTKESKSRSKNVQTTNQKNTLSLSTSTNEEFHNLNSMKKRMKISTAPIINTRETTLSVSRQVDSSQPNSVLQYNPKYEEMYSPVEGMQACIH